MKTHYVTLFVLILLIISTIAWSQQLDSDEDIFSDFDVDKESNSLTVKGFVGAYFGPRLFKSLENEFYTLGEIRTQVDLSYKYKEGSFNLITDLKYSPLQLEPFEDIRTGVGILDIRELSFSKSIGSSFELKAGRQILTWGTGDMLFINDLFPKDWNSFFIGRQVEYLKAPTNAIKLSHYNKVFTLDLVWALVFTPDRYVDGNNLEYYHPIKKEITGKSEIIKPVERDAFVQDSELSLRLHKVFKGVEFDIYGYHGFWKTPEGLNEQNLYFFPKLSVAGASLRFPAFTGILNVEYGHYFSREFDDRTINSVRSSEDRLLFGFEKELTKNLIATSQFYVEYINDYHHYKQASNCDICREKLKTMLTLRLQYQTPDQRLKLSVLNFYSLTDVDLFSKTTISYNYSDRLEFNLGTNYFTGVNEHSFWGQFHSNSNLFGGAIWHY